MKSILLVLVPALALAQPMMLDPSKMSGIPRPDNQVPPGTITVRLIRGELSNRVTDHEVQLSDGSMVKTAKTDAEGRATFGGLSGGPWVATAKDGDTEHKSQPIELLPAVGTRVMLVFNEKAPPAGTVVVRAVGGDGGVLPGLEVKLGMASEGGGSVVERSAKTDDAGEAKFTGLEAKPTVGYLAKVLKDGTEYPGKPFRLPDNKGVLVVIHVQPITRELSSLQIAPGSHLIVQITDDAVQVIEVWRLHNAGSAAVEVPGGLRFPLPDKAVSAQGGEKMPVQLAVSGHEAVWKGPFPPGETELQVMFMLPYSGDTLEFVQPTPVAFAETAIVTEKIDGFSIQGPQLESEERELGGRKLLLLRGPGTTAGGELRLQLVGLPHGDPTWRYVTAALTVLLLVGFGLYAAQGDGGASESRRKLEAKREALLNELVALEKSDGPKKKRDDLAEKLAKLYRELDNA
jgi:hypothetical protein